MNIIDRNQQIINNFQRFSVNEDKIMAYGHEGITKLAEFNGSTWQHFASDYDNLVGSILSVDVHNQSSIDLDQVEKELLDKIKDHALLYLKADFETVAEFCLELESKSITALQQDSMESELISGYLNNLVDPWLASPVIFFFSDYQEKLKKMKTLLNGYSRLKLIFDNYLKTILPVYKMVISSEQANSASAQDKQQRFITNLELLKKATIQECRSNLTENPVITPDKLNTLFTKDLTSIDEVFTALN